MGYWADVPDPCGERGRRYEWTYLLTIICAALLGGNRSVRAMAQWAFLHRQEFVTATLYQAITDLFDDPPSPAFPGETLATTTTALGHGRLEIRRLESSTALNGYLDWPGVPQVLRRTRRAIRLKTGAVTEQVTYGITSLRRRQALPTQLEPLWCGHRTIGSRRWLSYAMLSSPFCVMRAGQTS